MIQTYLLMDFCCQMVNFVWGQYFLNISRKRINVVSKTEHDLCINWLTYMLNRGHELCKSVKWQPSVHLWYMECGWSVHSSGIGDRVALECTLQTGVYTPSGLGFILIILVKHTTGNQQSNYTPDMASNDLIMLKGKHCNIVVVLLWADWGISIP